MKKGILIIFATVIVLILGIAGIKLISVKSTAVVNNSNEEEKQNEIKVERDSKNTEKVSINEIRAEENKMDEVPGIDEHTAIVNVGAEFESLGLSGGVKTVIVKSDKWFSVLEERREDNLVRFESIEEAGNKGASFLIEITSNEISEESNFLLDKDYSKMKSIQVKVAGKEYTAYYEYNNVEDNTTCYIKDIVLADNIITDRYKEESKFSERLFIIFGCAGEASEEYIKDIMEHFEITVVEE